MQWKWANAFEGSDQFLMGTIGLSALEFSIPMFFIQGAEDFTTSTALERNYFDSSKAPHKEFVAINGAGHFAVFMGSDQFLQELVKLVGPSTLRGLQEGWISKRETSDARVVAYYR